MYAHTILVATNGAAQGTLDIFWGSGLGTAIRGLLIAVGVLVVLTALFKGVPKFIGGKIGEGLKSIIGGLIVAAICFQPALLTDLISVVGNLIGVTSSTAGQLTNGGTDAPTR